MMPKRLITFLAYLLALVFLFAAVTKILYFNLFIKDIGRLNVVLPSLIFPVSFILIALELMLASLLLIKRYRRLAAGLASGLITFFLLMVSYLLIQGNDVKCGCFGPWGQAISFKLLLQDIILLLFAVTIYISHIFEKRRQAP